MPHAQNLINSPVWNVPTYDDGSVVCESDYHTPETHPEEFDRYRKGLKNKKDGSYWEKDRTNHGGPQYKRWPSVKDHEKGRKPQSIWPDGRIRK